MKVAEAGRAGERVGGGGCVVQISFGRTTKTGVPIHTRKKEKNIMKKYKVRYIN